VTTLAGATTTLIAELTARLDRLEMGVKESSNYDDEFTAKLALRIAVLEEAARSNNNKLANVGQKGG
jgi:hypothetical protein